MKALLLIATAVVVYGAICFFASIGIARTLGTTAQVLFIPVVVVIGLALGTLLGRSIVR